LTEQSVSSRDAGNLAFTYRQQAKLLRDVASRLEVEGAWYQQQLGGDHERTRQSREAANAAWAAAEEADEMARTYQQQLPHGRVYLTGLDLRTVEEGRPSMATTVGCPTGSLKQESLTGWRQVPNATSCSRCGGLMVIEQCFDFRDDTGQLDFMARRCVQCGEVIDPLIQQNRQRQLSVGSGADQSSSGFARSKERS